MVQNAFPLTRENKYKCHALICSVSEHRTLRVPGAVSGRGPRGARGPRRWRHRRGLCLSGDLGGLSTPRALSVTWLRGEPCRVGLPRSSSCNVAGFRAHLAVKRVFSPHKHVNTIWHLGEPSACVTCALPSAKDGLCPGRGWEEGPSAGTQRRPPTRCAPRELIICGSRTEDAYFGCFK